MADLKISFTLGERDLKHFRRVMAKAIDVANPEKEQEITAAAVALIEKARAVEPPDYVRERLDRLERIVAMSYDDEWRIPEVVRRACSPRCPISRSRTTSSRTACPGSAFSTTRS